MAKAKTLYACTECGDTLSKWQGQCPVLQAWNTLVESIAETAAPSRYSALSVVSEVVSLAAVEAVEDERVATGINELDRVLGGGVVKGGVVLIGGDPGIGKSTLLLQALAGMSAAHTTLYVSGEESARQIALRASRLQLDADSLQLLAEIQLEKILATLNKHKPFIAVIDSIQTVYSEALQSAPGSVAQVRECAAQLTRYAKQTGR
jgi:DNA replication and repair protein RadA